MEEIIREMRVVVGDGKLSRERWKMKLWGIGNQAVRDGKSSRKR